MQSLFTYGSLMCEDIMTAVAGGLLLHQPALLPDHRRYALSDEPYPGLVPEFGASVEGIVYHGLKPRAWARLDRFEGELYNRHKVMVWYPDGGREWVYCYIVKAEFRELLSDKAWDFDRFLRHDKKLFETSYSGFSEVGQKR